MTAIHRIAKLVADTLFAVALFAGALMMVHVTADVIARTLFNHPLSGTGEITATWYMIAAAFLPLGHVTLRNEHVTADLFFDRLPRAGQRIVRIFVDLLFLAYLSVFVWQSWVSAMRRTESGEVWEIFGGYLPVWPTRWFLPVAGAAMILSLAARMIARETDTPDRPQDAH